jgi:hypothetical protein
MEKKEIKSPSAWEIAARNGYDMSLLEDNLRKTPVERIKTHQRALNTALMLRKAVEKQHAGHGSAVRAAN